MVKMALPADMVDFEYWRPNQWLEADTIYAGRPPIKYKHRGFFRGFSQTPGLAQLGTLIGLDSEEETKCLLAHEKRLRKYRIINPVITFSAYILIATVALLIYVIALDRVITNYGGWQETSLILLYCLILGIIGGMAVLLGQRLASAILDRQYADSLAFAASLNLFIQISIEDTLLFSDDRGITVKRARGLRKFLILLAYRYSSTSSESIDSARDHYKKMEYYIEDVERQILISNSRTQQTLKDGLFRFTKILLTSRYGQFKYARKVPVSTEKVESNTRRLLNGVLRMIGIAIPLVLFVGLFLYPDRFKFLGTYANVVAVVSLAWLLLSIDSALQLGVIDRVSTLAKAIKDLK